MALDDAAYGPPESPYRVKVGRFNERWYQDLDTDPEWRGPAVTTVKKASGGDWSWVAIKRIATALVADRRLLDDVDDDEVAGTLRNIDKRGLREAADRGTAVHALVERALIDGRLPVEHGAALDYASSVEAFLADHRPALVAAEFTVINRELHGVGYGGTCDAMVTIDGKRYLVDWKSRGADSKHGAYPEEAAQLGAYAMAEYTIIDGERAPMPTLDGGLVVSIRPDGYAVYPIDLAAAGEHFAALHAWWCARRAERAAIGRMWPKVQRAAATTDTDVGDLAALRSEVAQWTPADRQALVDYFAAHDVDKTDPDKVAAAMRAVRSFADVVTEPAGPTPEPEPVTALPRPLAEGDDVDADDIATLKALYGALDAASQSWVRQIDVEARQAGVSIRVNDRPTVRRLELNRALLRLAGNGFDDGDAVRALCALTIGAELAHSTAFALGALVGCHDADGARRFAANADVLIDGGFAMSFTPRPTLTPSVAA